MALCRTLTTDVNIYPCVAYMTFQNLMNVSQNQRMLGGGTRLLRSLKKKILSLDLGLALLHSIANICSRQQVGQIPQPPEDCCSILLSRGVYWWQSSVTTWSSRHFDQHSQCVTGIPPSSSAGFSAGVSQRRAPITFPPRCPGPAQRALHGINRWAGISLHLLQWPH